MSFLPKQISTNSTLNTSTTPLGASATFTGTGELDDYSDVMVSCQTDQTGTLYFDFSVDGTNWGTFPVNGFAVAAGIHEFHTAVKGPRYFRVRMVNDGTPQTYLRLSTYYGIFAGKPNAPLSQGINSDNDATVVKAVIAAEAPDGEYGNIPTGGVSPGNSTDATLGVSASFNGTWEDVSGYAGLTILVDGTSAGTADGTLYMEFSHDSVTTHRSIAIAVDDVTAAAPRTLGVVAKYFQIRYDNGTTATTSFTIQTIYHTSQVELVSRLNSTIGDNIDVSNVRAVISGRQPNGKYTNAALDESGAFLTSIKSPATAFGELQVAELNPIAQADAVYGLLDKVETFSATGGSTAVVDGNFVCATGVSIGGYGVIRGRRALRYRPGQGSLYRWTALFDKNNDVSLSLQLAGAFNSTNGFLVGYHDAQGFGVMHRYAGMHEIRELTIGTPASGSETADIELNTVTYNIPVTSGTAEHNAYEVAEWLDANQSVWEVSQNNGKVILFNLNAGPAAGSYSVSSNGTFAGSIAQTAAGVVNTEDWTYQGSFTDDNLDGTGPSGMTIDPDLGNVYELNLQYIGYGEVSMSVENPETGRFFIFHRWKFANNRSTPTLSNPTLKIGWISESLGSSTNIQVRGGSLMAAIQGKIHPFRKPRGDVNTRTAVSTTLTSLIAIRVRNVFAGTTQLSEVLPKIASVTPEGSKSCEIKILLNPTFAGETNWLYEDEAESIVEVDVAGTTFSDEGTVLSALNTFGGQPALFKFTDLAEEGINPLHLERGDVLCIAARMTGGAAQDITGAITWLED